MSLWALGSGPTAVAVVGIICIAFYGYEWYTENRKTRIAEEKGTYYTLPPRSAMEAARIHATVEDQTESQPERRERCAICHEHFARYIFVPCGHVCVCEPCLVAYGHTYLEERKRSFRGPCQLPCLKCRQLGFLCKTFV